MKLIKITPPDEEWVAWALVSSSFRYLCSIGVSFEHWEVMHRPKLLYFGLSSSGRRWIAIIGWFIFALPAVPMELKDK